MADSWIYKEEYEDLVNEKHSAPIIDREILYSNLEVYLYL